MHIIKLGSGAQNGNLNVASGVGLVIVVGACVFLVWNLVTPRRSSGAGSGARSPGDGSPGDAPPRRPPTGRPPTGHAAARAVVRPKVVEGPAWVVDGDGLVIRGVQVRLFGVDAPEFDHPYGRKARGALIGLCKGQRVRAEIVGEDQYGRAVARCYLPDGRDLSAEMVRRGLALDWPRFSGGRYREHETRDARRKLWLADARQKGRMDVWKRYEARQARRNG